MRAKRLLVLATATALVGALPMLAQTAVPPLKQDGTPDTGKREAARLAAIKVDGGPVARIYTATNNEPALLGEAPSFVEVPGMVRQFSATGEGATIVVIFSAETQLRGDAGDFDWIEVVVRLDGTPMQPHSPTSPTAYSGHENYGMNSGTFVQRVGPGNHTVQAFWKIVDSPPDNSLTGWIDDTTLLIFHSF